jgi:hypothetical protein
MFLHLSKKVILGNSQKLLNLSNELESKSTLAFDIRYINQFISRLYTIYKLRNDIYLQKQGLLSEKY